MAEKTKKLTSPYLDLDSLKKEFKKSYDARVKEDYEQELAKKRRSEEIKKKVAKENISPKEEMIDTMETGTKLLKARMNWEDAEAKAKKRKQGETGSEAEKRLFKELKTLRNSVATSSGDALYPGDLTDPEIAKMQLETVKGNKDARSTYMDSEDYRSTKIGEPGTPTRIANERMDEIKGDLKISQQAIKENKSFKDKKRDIEFQNKYKEFYKRFTIPGINPKKRDHLAKISAQEWYKKAYAK
tara:strand:+ start:361 stop:1089 length:729 start_codon:yes stop_codon:yes gene_type:complete